MRQDFQNLVVLLIKLLFPLIKYRALNHSTMIVIRISDWTISVNPYPCLQITIFSLSFDLDN